MPRTTWTGTRCCCTTSLMTRRQRACRRSGVRCAHLPVELFVKQDSAGCHSASATAMLGVRQDCMQLYLVHGADLCAAPKYHIANCSDLNTCRPKHAVRTSNAMK